jgi:hypothetical protein
LKSSVQLWGLSSTLCIWVLSIYEIRTVEGIGDSLLLDNTHSIQRFEIRTDCPLPDLAFERVRDKGIVAKGNSVVVVGNLVLGVTQRPLVISAVTKPQVLVLNVLVKHVPIIQISWCIFAVDCRNGACNADWRRNVHDKRAAVWHVRVTWVEVVNPSRAVLQMKELDDVRNVILRMLNRNNSVADDIGVNNSSRAFSWVSCTTSYTDA